MNNCGAVGNRADWAVVPGFVEDTIAGTTHEDVECRRAAIVFIDVDLGKPARLALDFVRPALRNGGIIILDDYSIERL